ncbi:MAG: glutamyl-tRNA reductase [Candidatus Omnitrophica bacterium]|nr:glutamyl-tRNA reductase [Candidatus Omnitrophota bacterium]MCM8826973.1 glutamyl-tRNA reductase [Candidatus Omnitrophota bacterium]
MNFITLGTNHKYSPIEIRESLSFPKKWLQEALFDWVSYGGIKTGVILSTCNRVELYADVLDIDRGISSMKDFLAEYHQKPLSMIEHYLYTYIDKEAIKHLFNVASGLDSQILGEAQVLEQVKISWQQAKRLGITDRLLDMIFERAIETSLKVRTETEISKGRLSLGSIVIKLLKTKFNLLSDKRILIIGVGKISELVVRYLKKEKINLVFVANRTYEKATELARYINAEVVRFDRLKEKLKDIDIIISATSSPHLILKKEDILEIIGYRQLVKQEPLLIVDLAVPRDVDPQVKSIIGVELFDLDDLNFLIEKNLEIRKQGIPKAKEIIEEEVNRLCRELGVLELEEVPLP